MNKHQIALLVLKIKALGGYVLFSLILAFAVEFYWGYNFWLCFLGLFAGCMILLVTDERELKNLQILKFPFRFYRKR